MMYLLDTDMVSLFQHGHPAVCAAVGKHSPREVAITVLTVEEQLSGWYTELRRNKKA
jgi:tRNA(fMet)-specific endonuclease VapC